MNRRSTSAISPQSQREQQQLRHRRMQQQAAANQTAAAARPANAQQASAMGRDGREATQATQQQNAQYGQRIRAQQQQARRARQAQMARAKAEEMAQAQAYFDQLQASQRQGGSGFFRKLFSLAIVVGFAYGGYWMHQHHKLDPIYAMFKSGNDSAIDSSGFGGGSANVSEADLEIIANRIIQTKATNGQTVDQYLAKWNKLSERQKRKMMDTVWYQHFSFVVESRIRDYQRRVAFGSKGSSSAEMKKLQNASIPLMKIASAVGIVKKPVGDSISSKQERFKEMMAEVEKDIREQRSEKDQQRSELLQTAKLESRSLSSIKSSPDNSNHTTRPKTSTDKSTSNSLSSKQSAKPSTPMKIEHVLTQRDIDDILSEYKLAYQKGDVDTLLTLFKGDKSQNSSSRIALLRENYETSFKLSRQRQIKLNNLKWEQQGEQLFGTGDYKEIFKLGNGKDTREISAKLNLELRSRPGQQQGAYIANFNLLDQTVTQIKSEATVARNSVKELISHKKPVAPTAAELQDLVAKFIRVWETGNSKELVALLDKDAKTNDKTSRKDIVNEYSNIFQSTYDREMYISNMQWETSGSFAKGRGFLESMSFSKEDDDIKNVSGKIQIVARREGNVVTFTHFYQLARDQ